MRLGFQGRLFASSFTLILLGGLVTGFVLERGLRRDIKSSMETELVGYARAAGALVRATDALNDAQLDELADRMGEATNSRITLLDRAGEVLGDSSLDLERVRQLPNHADRPEVQQAVAGGVGHASRYSSTLRERRIYAAVAVRDSGPVTVVRASQSAVTVEAIVRRLRLRLAGSALFLVAVAALMSSVGSWFLSRALHHLVDGARAVVIERRQGHRLDVRSQDELGRLAGAFNQLLDDLDTGVDRLQRERSTVQAVLEGMSEALIALDAEGRITLCNPAALVLLELVEAPVGQKLSEILEGKLYEQLSSVDGERGARTVELELDDDPPLRLVARQRFRPDGTGSVVILLDVTRVRALEKIRKDFVANVSHELRTPVAVLQANAETLLDGALEDPVMARRFVEAIHRQAQRLAALVNDLLDISRIEAGRYGLEPEEVKLLPAILAVVDTVDGAAAAKGLGLDVEVPQGLVGVSDPKAFDQILRNFLENAVKYTPDGGRVTVRVREAEGKLRISVEDDGPGIDAEHRDRLFERFYRVDQGRSRHMGGTGLGLSIAKRLAEAQHGRVGFEAAEPHGSVFWFEVACRPGEGAE